MNFYKKISMVMAIAGALMIGSMGYAAAQTTNQEQNFVCEQDSLSMADIALPVVTGVTSGLAYRFFGTIILAGLVSKSELVNLLTLPLGFIGIRYVSSLKNDIYEKVFKNKDKAELMDYIDSLAVLAAIIAR